MKQYRIRLRELLAERMIKITKVHEDTGISRPTLLSIYTNSSKGIQFETINKLCDYFRITPGELFVEVEDIKPVFPNKNIFNNKENEQCK